MNLFFLIILVFSSTAFAGERGNGGDIIICRNGNSSIRSAQLYDHFEAVVRDQRQLDLGGPELSVDEKVELIIKRIERLDLSRAHLYRSWHKNFYKEAIFLKGIELQDVADTGDGLMPTGCAIHQLVVQMDDPLRPNRRYTFSQDYWDLLDNDNKAGTILHELILREFTGKSTRHENSRVARFFNGLFSDPVAAEMSWEEYTKLIVQGKIVRLGTPFGGSLTRASSALSFTQIPDAGFLLRGFQVPSNPNDETFELTSTLQVVNNQTVHVYPIFGALGLPSKVDLFFLSSGLSPAVHLMTSVKADILMDGWSLSYKGNICLDVGKDEYSILGNLAYNESGIKLSHPDYLPNGCNLSVQNLTKVKPYPNPMECFKPNITSFTNVECYVEFTELVTDLATLPFGEGKLAMKNSSGLVVYSGKNTATSFPAQTIELTSALVQLGKTNKLLEVTTSRTQSLLNSRGRRFDVPYLSRLSLNPQGLVTACTTYEGRNCLR